VTPGSADAATIVLVAGIMKTPDRLGHHDYLGGCRVAARLLAQSGVRATVGRDGWPEDETALDAADALVLYTGGLTRHALFRSPERIERLQRLVDRGIGLVVIHQAVRCSPELAPRAVRWIGGVHLAGESGRGHWPTRHAEFPLHPVTSGVEPWDITDGWLNEIRFVDDMRGITPLVWSSREHGGSSAGGTAAVVAWAYERPGGGRSFSFTGLDAHSAWSVAGVRRLIVNGILWSAGTRVPPEGAPCVADEALLNGCLTPRGSRAARAIRRFGRRLRRLAGSRARH
jgi:hypothetical protein